MRYQSLFSLASILPAAYGLALDEPKPTGDGPNRAFGGVSPATTPAPAPRALEQRQQNIINPLCGWINGDWETALTCSASRTCMLYKSAGVGMAGCCVGSNRQDCGWANTCVDYSAIRSGRCGTSCQTNSFVKKCTNAGMPACMTFTYLNDGILDYDCGTASTIYTVRYSASDPTTRQTRTIRLSTVAAAQVTGISSISVETGKKAVKLAVGAIVGIAVAALFLIFCVVVGICICLKRKKKRQALAQNAQIVAANQANNYQPQTHPQNVQQSQPLLPQQQPYYMQGQPPMQMQGGYASPPPPMPAQSPGPQMGYFPPAGQKFDGRTSVHEYAMSPISNPPTPAPAYSQPYGTQNVPPMPHQQQPPPPGVVSPIQQYRAPADGAVEVDAVSVPHVPAAQANQPGPHVPAQGNQPGPQVYELGQGR